MRKKNEPVGLYEIRITLLYVEPTIWRQVAVPKDITLGDLHTVIQIAMGWEDDHLHEFQIGKKRYGPIMPEPSVFSDSSVDEDTAHLNGVAKPKAKFSYWYDFGDDWMHEILIEREIESATGRRSARCVAGQNACPPEDCGGFPGYAELVEILANPAHEEYGEILEWVGDDFDPNYFDLALADRRLTRLKV